MRRRLQKIFLSKRTGWMRMLFCVLMLIAMRVPLLAQAENLAAAKSQRAKQAMTAGKFQEAAALYRELIQALPQDPGLRMNLGLALYSAGQYREAIDPFRAFLERQPDSSSVWLLLGLSYLKLHQPNLAIEPLEKVIEAEPANKTAHLELADTFMAARRPFEATAHFKRLTELDPGYSKAWQGLGLSYVALSRQAFMELEKIAPNSAYWELLLARSLASRGQFHSAFKLYREALAQAPGLRGIHGGIAKVYRQTGHPDWAEVEERRERDLPRPDCAAEDFECDFLAGRYERLLETTRKFNKAESYYWQAQACSKLSEQCFARLSQMPPSEAIHDLMAEAYRIQGKYGRAIQEWQKALELAPQDRRLKKGLARALWLNRNYEKARPLLEELIKLEPESAGLNYQLGDTLLHWRQRSKPFTTSKRQ